MNKKFLSTLILISCLVSGCVQMPKPITDTKTSQAEINMIVRSLSYDGNNFRINKKLKSAKAGEPLKIAYISSSIFTDENERESSTADEVTKAVKNYLGEKSNVSFICHVSRSRSSAAPSKRRHPPAVTIFLRAWHPAQYPIYTPSTTLIGVRTRSAINVFKKSVS